MGKLLIFAIEIGIAYGAVAFIANEWYLAGAVCATLLYKSLDANQCRCLR